MEAIFEIIPFRGSIPNLLGEDLSKYLLEKDGIRQIIKLKDFATSSEKERLYAFLFGPVMAAAVDGYTAAGYEGIDKVKARFMLEAEFCKGEAYNPKMGKVSIYTESISSMGIKRLHKFITDVLFFLESELGQKVPDAEAFKLRVKTGKDYEPIKPVK